MRVVLMSNDKAEVVSYVGRPEIKEVYDLLDSLLEEIKKNPTSTFVLPFDSLEFSKREDLTREDWVNLIGDDIGTSRFALFPNHTIILDDLGLMRSEIKLNWIATEAYRRGLKPGYHGSPIAGTLILIPN